ncbi:cytochrome c biogenesis protein CcdA [Candidatus Soleaferrea massiliensis]|uniref:redoxin domain-containing protein n=1 Tax=Candidatus Soleaferrea massiliensis TaxID=1470354 RepID=UPI00058E7878|nr:cytochrome c biogenesis protein CcdA [Candidatus Soleaferrea massiliensis]
MGFSIETGVPILTVFLQGILSFFSPCVLPLVPLYIGYLAGGAKIVDADGTIRYKRSKVMLNTLFFVIGVSFAFFLLGFGFTAAGRFFSGNRLLFSRIGGVIVILFGLFQLGVFGSKFLNRDHRLPFFLNKLSMNPLVALVLGFTFSFAWTPCVGPALGSVLLMASSANSSAAGFALIGVYTVGFVLPFLAVGLFTGTLLDFFKKHQKVVKYTVKVGGALMILMGVMMITGWMNSLTGYLSSFGGSDSPSASQSSSVQGESPSTPPQDASGGASSSGSASESSQPAIPAPDFKLTDQYGKEHSLSEYRGKVVFLNFWATWCGPCQQEMPDIQEMYLKNNENQDDLVVLGVANPKTAENRFNSDVSIDEVKQFLTDGGYTYPVAMDLTGEVFQQYGISAFPTTFMIDREGNVFGYLTGTLTKSMMEDIVRQTMEGKRS